MLIAILGAGSIGCYVGGRLAAVGGKVLFIGRERLQGVLQQNGLQLSHFNQSQVRVRPEQFEIITHVDMPAGMPGSRATQEQLPRLVEADIVLVAVKSQDTLVAAKQLKQYIKPSTIVISLQNGVGNVAALKSVLVGFSVVGGMVPFNVVNQGEGASTVEQKGS